MSHRKAVFILWIALVSAALGAQLLWPGRLAGLLAHLAGASPGWTHALYLGLGCLRGFTLVPATSLVVAGLLFLQPVPLFLLTLIGIVVSSAAVYTFADRMGFGEFFERRYPSEVSRLRALMTRRELPIVVAWSFFPMAPTDLVCYVCGSLKVDLRTCLLGVAIGEGAICALYIYMGGHVLAWLR